MVLHERGFSNIEISYYYGTYNVSNTHFIKNFSERRIWAVDGKPFPATTTALRLLTSSRAPTDSEGRGISWGSRRSVRLFQIDIQQLIFRSTI